MAVVSKKSEHVLPKGDTTSQANHSSRRVRG